MLQKEISTKVGLAILVAIFIVCGGVLLWSAFKGDLQLSFETNIFGKHETSDATIKTAPSEVKKFVSADEFKKYLIDHTGDQQNYYGFGGGVMTTRAMMAAEGGGMESADLGLQVGTPTGLNAPSAAPIAGRVSETNVQVAGIDEPDIVKTDGKELYYSRFNNNWVYSRPVPMMDTGVSAGSAGISESMIAPPYYNQGEVSLIAAFPPADMKQDGKIDKSGNLLLDGKTLIVFSNDQKIYAYDVTDKANPKEKWTAKFGDREILVGARLMNGKIYLATQSGADFSRPCPIIPMTIGKNEISIACTDIYYPTNGGTADVTYNFMVLDSQTGDVQNKSAFVGASGQTVFYMSDNSIYLTYPIQVDTVEVAFQFFSENSDLVPSWVVDRLNTVRGYDLSPNAKSAELSSILEKFRNSLNNDDALKLENEMTNRMTKFYEKYRREIGKTGIVKIALNNFSAMAGEVPGAPLNQFSLDEYEKHLRIAVTIGQGWWGMGGFGGSSKTVSDVYVLNDNMDVVGAVKDMGETERIYSVRFIGDRGYVVTFRQTDPFYVLDLGNPKAPALRGELKIPGFSSYLHPLEGHKVLGIGREDGKVKLSIFDATSAENPKEAAKYQLNEYWSEALDNHHAFLLDKKHQVFFIPGSQGGYVFSYIGDELKLMKAVSGTSVQRAIYLEDYMYLIGTNNITVLDEKTWDKIKEFELK